jgi:hypothetical protein
MTSTEQSAAILRGSHPLFLFWGFLIAGKPDWFVVGVTTKPAFVERYRVLPAMALRQAHLSQERL